MPELKRNDLGTVTSSADHDVIDSEADMATPVPIRLTPPPVSAPAVVSQTMPSPMPVPHHDS